MASASRGALPGGSSLARGVAARCRLHNPQRELLTLARRYAAPESVNFINGVLDAVGRELLEKRHGL